MSVTSGSSNQLADNFKEQLTGKLSEDVVRRTVESLEKITESQLKAATAHAATGALASLIFYVKGQCTIRGGKSFNGSAYGASSPGGGALFGDVYLAGASTLDQLYRQTTDWAFTAEIAYTAFYFFDSNGNLLGHFQAGSVSTVAGSGTGSGSWS
ncbi:MAG TPA: VapA/VapB family virulence-associated protein [Thermoanaerobaculia bacterium]|jgi:hypothetical protein